MSNKEEFEEWYSGIYRETIHILPNGQYASLRQQHSWDAWQARVPEGYVVVPKEPSAKMIEIGSNALGNGKMGFATYMDVNNSYKAMIEAVEK